MINGTLRPWGKPNWLLQNASLRDKSWLLIGSLSTQDRCLSMLRHGGISYNISHAAFFEIQDVESRFSEQTKIKLEKVNAEWVQETTAANRSKYVFNIFDPIKGVKTTITQLLSSELAENVVLDVSTLPERFLFPIVRWLVESPLVKNLVISYMLPEKYTDEELAYNASDATHLPTFVYDSPEPEKKIKHVIVGVGFLPFSLPEWLKKTYANSKVKVSLVFPFPSSPGNVRKSWEFVRQIESNVTLHDDQQIARVAVHDISGCFDRIGSITEQGTASSVFAPFGPKAHSVAMCLQAMKMGAEAYFTHPAFYHPEYSTGAKMDGQLPAGYAYAIKLNSRNLYS